MQSPSFTQICSLCARPRVRFAPARALLVAIILLCAVVLPATAQRYTFRQYDETDGLTNMTIRTLYQDRTGYIWACSENGLFRFDGERFRRFSQTDGLPDSWVLNISESADGTLWALTSGGLSRLKGDRFEAQPMPGDVTRIYRSFFFDAAGHLYVEHASGILMGTPYGKGSYKFVPLIEGRLHSFALASDALWYGKDNQLWRYSAGTGMRMDEKLGLPEQQWSALTYDQRGNLWAQSNRKLFELEQGHAQFQDRSSLVPAAAYNGLSNDRYGRVYVLHDSGVTRLDGDEVTPIDGKHGLPGEGGDAVLLDREGSLWIAADGGGLMRQLGQGQWASWKTGDGLSSNLVWAIAEGTAQRTWIGTSAGVDLLKENGEAAQKWSSQNGLAANEVLALARTPAGDIFAGTNPGGISHFDASGHLLHTYTAKSGYTGSAVTAMTVDARGILWVASYRGCYRSRETVDHEPMSFEPVVIPGLAPNTIFSDIATDSRDNIWIATSAGLLRYGAGSWRTYGVQDGLRSGGISLVVPIGDDLWIAYRRSGGVSRLTWQGDRLHVEFLSVRDGLSSDLIYGVATDRAGRLWLSSDAGIDMRETGQWHHFGRENGLIWNDADARALRADTQGRMWVGTSAGLSRWTPPRYPVAESPAPVIISDVETGTGKDTRQWRFDARPKLEYKARSLLIRYAALSFVSNSRVRFRYRVKGYDTSWTETKERTVRLAGLPPGSYTFQVVTANSNGLWTPAPAEFAFSIRSPWWSSWWFLTLCVAAVASLLGTLWNLRTRALLAQRAHLQNLVQKRTAELTMTNAQLEEIAYCDQLTSLANRRAFQHKFLERFETAERFGERFCLLLIDLDRFKPINDTFGHATGDAVLLEVANRLRKVVRQTDYVARLGGDEFAILLSSGSDAAVAEEACHRIVNSLGREMQIGDNLLRIGASVGAGVYPQDGSDEMKLYTATDRALYIAKQQRSAYSFASGAS